jgi:hypothetical protein
LLLKARQIVKHVVEFKTRARAAFLRIFLAVPQKETQFFENRSLSAKCHNTSKINIVFIVILRIPEKLDLLLIVTAKLLQNSIKNR